MSEAAYGVRTGTAVPGERWAQPLRIRRAGESQDIIRLAFDPVTALIRAYAGGCWSIAETHAYLEGLSTMIAGSRTALGKARVLLDRRDVLIQPPEVAAALASANGTIFAPEDRIALVVSSSIAKAGLRQRLPHAGSKAFLSISAAETWLRAFAG